MLYAKVLQNKKNNTISSIFYDKYGRSIDPMTLLNKQCYVNSGLIKIEGIFVGSKVSLQVKLYEAEIEVKESGLKRLLRPSMENMALQAPPMAAAVVSESVVENNEVDNDNENENENENDNDNGSIKGDDDDVTPVAREPSPPPAAAASSVKPRRIAKK
jgi:hypothetical protein